MCAKIHGEMLCVSELSMIDSSIVSGLFVQFHKSGRPSEHI